MAFQSDAFGLNLWRFIAGIGIGVELVTIDAYIAELVPAALRGRAFAYNSAIQFVGGARRRACCVAAGSDRAVRLRRLALGRADRLVRRGLRLVDPSGAFPKARAGSPSTAGWKKPIARFWRLEAPAAARRAAPRRARPSAKPRPRRFGEIWQGPYLARTVMLIIFNIFQTVGFYGFSNWVPTLLIKQGISVTQSLQYTFIIAIAAPFGPLLGAALGDKFERKWLIVAAAFAIAVFGLAVRSDHRAPLPLIVLGVLADAVEQYPVVCLPRLSGRTLSDANPRHWRSASSIPGAGCRPCSAPLRSPFLCNGLASPAFSR